jgi:UDP:flavonoid glycosyltransferase YjiC (YdhE family)
MPASMPADAQRPAGAGLTGGRRWLVFSLPRWAHLATCLGIATQLVKLGDEVQFVFVYPPERWMLEEIAAHGHECDWSLRYARDALRRPGWSEQFRNVVSAEVELIRTVEPAAIINDLYYTTPLSGRACGVPVVSIIRCIPSFEPTPPPSRQHPSVAEWNELLWGDLQLVPHGRSWLEVRTPRAVHCRPCWVERACDLAATGLAAQRPPASLPAAPVLGVLSTASAHPLHRRHIQAAFERLDCDWLLCDPFSQDRGPRVTTWGDLSVLLPKARVLVCVGGHQLVTRALADAVPVVVLGTDELHVEHYGRALEAAGAGIYLRAADVAPPTIAEAVRTVLADAGYQAATKRLRRSFQREPDAASAVISELWS